MDRRTTGLAIHGGKPLFARPLTTGQLANRDPEKFFELASQAFERRWLSNQGPLLRELEERLSELHGTRHCIAVANACFALILAIRALARPKVRKVLMPSFTFRGLPHVVRWAGLEPCYCDVDPQRHTLAPESIARNLDSGVAAVLAVDNVNATCDIVALEKITRAAGVPLVLDSVYAVGASYGADPVGSRGNATVFSLHATKLINGFEGGYLTTNDDDLASALRSQRTFGFGHDGAPHQLGLNAKLNEIHAALALSNLPHVDSIIADNTARFAAYRRVFDGHPWISFADYTALGGNHGLVLMKLGAECPYARDELIAILRAENALVRPYYSPHLQEAESADIADLPVTHRLSRQFIQMPVGDRVTVEDIERLAELLTVLDRQRVCVP
jgi:dTDP-4-amino-4,6-dideoxygalactose transaminase